MRSTLLGEYQGAAVCALLADDWALDGEDDHAPVRREDWDLFFGTANTYRHFRPVTDAAEWRSVKRNESKSLRARLRPPRKWLTRGRS